MVSWPAMTKGSLNLPGTRGERWEGLRVVFRCFGFFIIVILLCVFFSLFSFLFFFWGGGRSFLDFLGFGVLSLFSLFLLLFYGGGELGLGLACSCRVVGSFARTLRDTRLMPWQIHLPCLHAEAAIDFDDDSPLPCAAAMVPADDEPASVRTDKHGGTWSVRQQASNGK